MLKITNILNPLTGGSTTQEYKYKKGKPLSKYIGYDGECVVSCNGEVVKSPVTDIYPANNEEYSVVIVPEGADRQTWRILSYAALSAFTLGAGSLYLKGISSFAKGMMWFVGANAINLLLQDRLKDMSTSQSYKWQYSSSPTASQGMAMPIIYGKTRVRPTIKNRYVTVEGDRQRLYVLYGVAAHKVDERDVPAYYPRSGDEEMTLAACPGETFINLHCILDLSHLVKAYFIFKNDGTFNIGWRQGYGTAGFANDVYINGRAIATYDKDVEWETRPGLPQQTVITGFDVTYTNYSQDTALYLGIAEVNPNEAVLFRRYIPTKTFQWNSHTVMAGGASYVMPSGGVLYAGAFPCYIYFDTADRETYHVSPTEPTLASQFVVATYSGSGVHVTYMSREETPSSTDWVQPILTLTNAHNIEVVFEFPYGLYGQPVGEETISATCRIFAQYKEHGTSTWINFSFQTLNPDMGDVLEVDADGLSIAKITRNKPEPFNISVQAVRVNHLLDPNKSYDVRIAASSPCAIRLVNIATLVYGALNRDGTRPGFTYPGEPLLGIRAYASGQLSSDMDVQVDVERSRVWVRDGTNNYPDHPGWNKLLANNHAWAVYDILVHGSTDHPAYPTYGNTDAESIYGCGLSYTKVDYTSFKEWADYITSIEYELNIVFDTFMTAWDAILRICQEGRGMVYPVGTKIYAFVDKPADVSQIFTMGNIHMDTFVERFLETSKKANMIEGTYYDADNNYSKTVVATRSADWDTSTEINEPTSMTLYGTTNFDQALSILWFMLKSNELLGNVISFGVDIDALAVRVGDVIEIQHDTLTVGEGGRIVQAEGSIPTGVTLQLDRTLTIEAGKKYELKIWHNNGTIETQDNIDNGFAAGSTIAFPSETVWDRMPAKYEPYSFGIAGRHAFKYRVINISRTSELMRTVTCIQYDEDIYDVYTPSDGVASVAKTAVGPAANILNLATNLKLREFITKNRTTGEYESSIVAVWDTVNGDPRGKWEVWFRDVDASDIDWQGEWDSTETYNYGDKVELNGKTYISVADNNTSIPFSV